MAFAAARLTEGVPSAPEKNHPSIITEAFPSFPHFSIKFPLFGMQSECNFLFFTYNWHTTRYNLACNRDTTQYNIPGSRGPKRFFPHHVSRTTRYNYLDFQKMSNPCGALSRKGLLYYVSRGTSSKRHLYQTEPSAAQPPRSVWDVIGLWPTTVPGVSQSEAAPPAPGGFS